MYINPTTLSNQSSPAPGLLLLNKDQEAMYLQYNGFVTVTSTDPVEIEPNTEAWETWKAAEEAKPVTPEPPTQEERLAALESAMLAMMIGGEADV